LVRARSAAARRRSSSRILAISSSVLHRDLEIVQVDRLGHEIEGAAVHRGAQIGHVAIGRDDDGADRRLLLAQPAEQGQAVHDRHVDVEQHQVDIGRGLQHAQRFFAVPGEAEGEFLGADLTPEALRDQQLEIGLVIDGEDSGRGHRALAHAAKPVATGRLAPTGRGRRTVNSVKAPTSLSTSIVPPCSWVTMS